MEDTTIQTISIIGGTVVALLGVIVPILVWMNKTMNRRFDDAQANMNQRFDDAQANMNQRFADAQANLNQRFHDFQANVNQRFDDAQKANDLAHAHIGDNIKNLERRIDSLERHVDSGLANVHMQLAALTPRAAPATEPPETARTPRP